MNYWHNFDKHNESFLSDCDQLTHQYRSTFSYTVGHFIFKLSHVKFQHRKKTIITRVVMNILNMIEYQTRYIAKKVSL